MEDRGMRSTTVSLNEVLEKVLKVDEASSILLDLIEGRVDEEKVVRLRKLAKEFVEEFKLSGPIAWVVRVLPERPILPGAPFLSIALRTIDKEGLSNVLSNLRSISAVIRLHLQRCISEVDPPIVALSVQAVPKVAGRVFEILSAVYLSKVKGWPELSPTDLIPFIRKTVEEAGSPDLYHESYVSPKIYAANISKSIKGLKEYESSATYIAHRVKDYSNLMKVDKVELNYRIIIYEEVDREPHKKVLEVFVDKALSEAEGRLSKKKLEQTTELFDLKSIKEDLEHRRADPYANHLYAVLKEMGLIEK